MLVAPKHTDMRPQVKHKVLKPTLLCKCHYECLSLIIHYDSEALSVFQLEQRDFVSGQQQAQR